MMTREEAIYWLENGWNHSLEGKYREAFDLALSALRPVSREQVVKVWRGEWTTDGVCRKCGFDAMYYDGVPVQVYTNFCPHCGAPMTDDAVQIVMERLEALHDTGN